MSVRVRCPKCGHVAQFPESLLGKLAQCPACLQRYRLLQAGQAHGGGGGDQPSEPAEPSLWRNPAPYIGLAVVAALVVIFVTVVSRERDPAAEREPGPQAPPLASTESAKPPRASVDEPRAARSHSPDVKEPPPSASAKTPGKSGGVRGDRELADFLNDFAEGGEVATPPVSRPSPPPEPSAAPQRTPLSPKELFAKASAAVVKIKVWSGGRTALGSGFFISSDGLIVTAYHLIRDADAAGINVAPAISEQVGENCEELGVTNAARLLALSHKGVNNTDGSRSPTCLLAYDASADLAVITYGAYLSRNLPHLELIPEGSHPAVGERVYAIGNPHGHQNTLSEGLISGIRQRSRSVFYGQDVVTLLQTTAAISGGSSGGPLLDKEGRVVGVVTSTEQGGQNINFAVSAENIRTLLKGARARMQKVLGSLEVVLEMEPSPPPRTVQDGAATPHK